MRTFRPTLLILPILAFAFGAAIGFDEALPAQALPSNSDAVQSAFDVAPALECEGCVMDEAGTESEGGGVTFDFTPTPNAEFDGTCLPRDGECKVLLKCKMSGQLKISNSNNHTVVVRHDNTPVGLIIPANGSKTMVLSQSVDCGGKFEVQVFDLTAGGAAPVATMSWSCSKCKEKKKQEATVQPPRDG